MNLPAAPPASSDAVRRVMRANRKRDTGPEMRLRRQLHAMGYRYRVAPLVRTATLAVRPDVVFPRRRLAVFVDGCFWHGCPEHGVRPKANPAYWTAKLERNRQRDRVVSVALAAAGWEVLRIWEHDAPQAAAAEVVSVLEALGAG